MEQLIVLLTLMILGFVCGSMAESRHYRSLQLREKKQASLPAVSLKSVVSPDRIVDKAVLVQGNVVISIDYFKRMLAVFRYLVGGNVVSYESLLDRARREAILRMKEAAGKADIILNTRIETSAIGQSANQRRSIGSVEAIAYGTAVTYTTDQKTS